MAAGLQGEYVSLFLVDPRGVPCPPYESAYWDSARWPVGWLLAQVEKEYAAVGLAPSPDLRDMPDHVSVEMEFIAVLCGREAEAWKKQEIGEAIGALRVEKSFLDSHLTAWFPSFARRLLMAGSEGPYAALAQGIENFMGYDKDLLGAILETPLAVEDSR